MSKSDRHSRRVHALQVVVLRRHHHRRVHVLPRGML
jgi:hypothetical protein